MQQTIPDQPARPTDLLTIAQLILSGLGMVFSFLGAAGLVVLGLTGFSTAYAEPAVQVPIFSLAWVCLLIGVLAIPSVVSSIQRLLQQEPHFSGQSSFRWANILIILWPLVLILGNSIASKPTVNWLFLPPLQIFAIGLPIFWLVSFARRNLPPTNQQREWGLINFSALLTMPLIMLVEILVMVALIGIGILWLNSQPDLLNSLEQFARNIIMSQANPEEVFKLLSPYLQNPLVIFSTLAIISGIIPLIEELFKPLAMWVLSGRNLSPAEGFVSGAICGATFALIESLFYLSNPTPEGWAILTIGRAGTGLLHTTCTALVGWALALTWQQGKYLRLALMYLLAVLLHGVWNSLSILIGLSAALNHVPANLQILSVISQIAPYGIGALVIGSITFLFASNRYLMQPSHETEA